ncbi:MAG: hypothetical protein KF819_21740 [Labilithrix sp.]|nr:hypothetical protein [Labilithrix sp.]
MRASLLLIAPLLACGAPLRAAHPAAGEELRPVIDPRSFSAKPPDAWTACESASECVLVGRFDRAKPRGMNDWCYTLIVNEAFAEAARASVKDAPSMEEGGCQGFAEPAPPRCERHRCTR